MRLELKVALRPAVLSNQRGVALLVVLWIFIFLFVVAFDFSASVRDEASAAHRYGDETQGYYLALAGFENALYDFLSQPPVGNLPQNQTSKLRFDGAWTDGPRDSGYRFRLIDEAGKVNINRVDETALRCIFTNLAIEEPRRSILVDSVMDWRDPDELHHINGAESDYYQSLPVPYSAKNGPFDTVEDLLWVRGVTTALFYGTGEDAAAPERRVIVGLRQIFTVDSPLDRVNQRTMSPEVCNAVTGIALDKCRAALAERNKLSQATVADLLKLQGVGVGTGTCVQLVDTNPSVVSVEAEGRPGESQVRRRVRGVVRAAGGQARFEILRWIDRDNQASGN